MQRKIKIRNLSIIFLIFITVFLRSIGLIWGLDQGDYLHPDEGTYGEIAKFYVNLFNDTEINFEEVKCKKIVYGFGAQIGVIVYPILKFLGITTNEDQKFCLVLVGRLLCVIYSVFLVLLTFFISLYVFKSEKAGFFSALLLSIFDLNITSSHYAVPDIPRVFWVYLSLFLILIQYRQFYRDCFRHWWLMLLVSFSCAMAFSAKFDVIPCVILLLSLVLLLLKKRLKFVSFILLLLLFCSLIVSFFYISSGFKYGIPDLNASYIRLRSSVNIIPKDNHFLYNPLVYFFALLSGTSFFVIIAFLISLRDILFIRKDRVLWDFNLFFLTYVIFIFVVLWISDNTFVRRVNIFLPYIAVITGGGLACFLRNNNSKIKSKYLRAAVLFCVISYTLMLSIISQSSFIYDTRYKARDYLNKFLAEDANVCYDVKIAEVESLPKLEGLKETEGSLLIGYNDQVDVVVLYEMYYSRYWKSFIIPFKIPKTNEESYKGKIQDFDFIQSLFSLQSKYQLITKIQVNHPFPERLLFKRLFGTYETFLGDVLIFKKMEILNRKM